MSHDDDELLRHFSDPEAVARYAEGPPRFVPGFADIHKMASILLAERAPEGARVLVLGAGGGLELKAFAGMNAGWRLDGIDPASEMLNLARQTVASFADRVQLHEGYIDDAPEGPFDAGACLLTLHFLARPERLRTRGQLRARLRPGAPLVVAHHSCPQEGRLARWLARSVAFAGDGRADPAQLSASAALMADRLPVLSVAEDETLLAEAGFSDIALFYAGFTFRGWVALA